MKIGVIGHTGFVGRAVYAFLESKYKNIEGVSRSAPTSTLESVDTIVNCAGGSKKYQATENFDAAVDYEIDVFRRIKAIKSSNPGVKLLHVSSIDAAEDTNYGLIKLAAEFWTTVLFPDYCILRLGGLVGSGLSKNVVFDLLNNNSLYTKLDSVYNFIHTSAVAEIVDHLIEHWESQEIINVAANKSISVKEIAEMMKKTPQVREDAVVEHYQIDTAKLQTFVETESSKYYIAQYFKEQSLL